MKNWKIISLLVIGGGALYLARLHRAGNKLSVRFISFPRVSYSQGAIVVSASAMIDNPSNVTLTIQKPYLRAILNGSEVGNSIPSNELVTIGANSKMPISDLNLQIPLTSLPAAAMAVVNFFTTEKAGIDLDLIVTTEVNGLPYFDTRPFTI